MGHPRKVTRRHFKHQRRWWGKNDFIFLTRAIGFVAIVFVLKWIDKSSNLALVRDVDCDLFENISTLHASNGSDIQFVNPLNKETDIKFDEISEEKARRILRDVCVEFRKYPSHCIGELDIKNIIVASNLRLDKEPVIAISVKNTLFVGDGTNMPRIVNHQIFHFVDAFLEYRKYRVGWPTYDIDNEFISPLARKSISQDSAESFAFLFYGNILDIDKTSAIYLKIDSSLKEFKMFCPDFMPPR